MDIARKWNYLKKILIADKRKRVRNTALNFFDISKQTLKRRQFIFMGGDKSKGQRNNWDIWNLENQSFLDIRRVYSH